MKSIQGFPGPLPFVLAAALLPACGSMDRAELRWLGDHQDDRDLGETGQTPRLHHAQGLDLRLSAERAREDRDVGADRQAVFVTLEVANDTGLSWVLDWRSARLRADDGRRYAPTKLERWDEDEGRWAPAAEVVGPGARETLVLTIPTGDRLDLVLELCLRWSYRLGGRKVAVASFFRNA